MTDNLKNIINKIDIDLLDEDIDLVELDEDDLWEDFEAEDLKYDRKDGSYRWMGCSHYWAEKRTDWSAELASQQRLNKI